MFVTISARVLTYQIWSALRRLNLKNKSLFTNNHRFYYVHKQLFSNALHNIIPNDGEREKSLASENNIFEKSLQKSQDTINFHSIETDFAYKVINNLKNDCEPFKMPASVKEDLQINEIQDIMNKDCTSFKVPELIEHLEKISWYAYMNHGKVDKYKYQYILDTLLKFNTCYDNNMLYRILYSLELWSASTDDLYHMHFLQSFEKNFMHVKQSTKETLLINFLLYRLNFLNDSSFAHKSLANINITTLDCKDLLQYAFLLRAINQRILISLRELEQVFAKNAILMNINELGLMSLLFYRYKYKYTEQHLLLLFMKNFKENIVSMDGVCIGAIIKSLK
jgi:hypothetical protein